MLNDDVINKVSERLVNRIEELNVEILKTIGETIKKIGKLTPTQAMQLEQVFRYGGDYEKITRKLAKITNLNVKDIQKIFEEVAKADHQFAKQFYEYRNIKYIPYDENEMLKAQVNSFANITASEYANISRTNVIGYLITDTDGTIKFREISNVYKEVVDKAILGIYQGKDTFDHSMRKIINDIGKSGLRYVEYESGKTRRLDSALRMNLRGAIRDMHNELQMQYGKEFDADGVEVSTHLHPAPDHMYVQGKQFSNEEFEKFQNDEDATSYDGAFFPAISDETGHDRRSIGKYNCYHYIFSIVLGVSQPAYSNEELKEILNKNEQGFEFDGLHYTNYEGTQLQRKIESAIREQKDIQILARSSGQIEEAEKAQRKINQLTKKYKELNEASGLSSKVDRLRVSGYRKIAIKK